MRALSPTSAAPVVIGAGGLASEVVDVLALHFSIDNLAIYSDIPPASTPPVHLISQLFQGTVGDLLDKREGFEFVVAIGDVNARERIFTRVLAAGGTPRSIIHPGAFVGSSSHLGAGSVVLAGATVTAEASVGRGCILNPGVRISHDCIVGDFVTLGPNAVLCGRSRIGEKCLVGANSTVNPDVFVCHDTTLGSGAVAIRDITDPSVWVGVPARPVPAGAGSGH